ncbi:hypothetical protein CDAR_240751 [Caerostris darwini]|uniref:Uncharacterized protein n=1 Tax=Caerostris darwini TaxID=1538125 RepID=A0AAV4UAA4_9ARAC|nr:hypothetical protein CDAR_240751 [Caerostris darwini]
MLSCRDSVLENTRKGVQIEFKPNSWLSGYELAQIHMGLQELNLMVVQQPACPRLHKACFTMQSICDNLERLKHMVLVQQKGFLLWCTFLSMLSLSCIKVIGFTAIYAYIVA